MNVLFICGGAFVGLDRIVAERVPNHANDNLLERVIPPTHLVRYGMLPELVGRLPIVAALNAPTEEDLVAILTKPKNAILKQFKNLCNNQGYDIGFTQDAVKAMASVAIRMQTGGCALWSVAEEALEDLRFGAEKGYRYIVDADVVNGHTPPKATKL